MCKHAYSSLNAAEHRSARPWKRPTSRTTGTQLAANAAQAPIGESIKRDRPGVGSHEDGGSLTDTNDAARDARLLSAAKDFSDALGDRRIEDINEHQPYGCIGEWSGRTALGV